MSDVNLVSFITMLWAWFFIRAVGRGDWPKIAQWGVFVTLGFAGVCFVEATR